MLLSFPPTGVLLQSHGPFESVPLAAGSSGKRSVRRRFVCLRCVSGYLRRRLRLFFVWLTTTIGVAFPVLPVCARRTRRLLISLALRSFGCVGRGGSGCSSCVHHVLLRRGRHAGTRGSAARHYPEQPVLKLRTCSFPDLPLTKRMGFMCHWRGHRSGFPKRKAPPWTHSPY